MNQIGEFTIDTKYGVVDLGQKGMKLFRYAIAMNSDESVLSVLADYSYFWLAVAAAERARAKLEWADIRAA